MINRMKNKLNGNTEPAGGIEVGTLVSPEAFAKLIGWHPESVRLAIRQGRIAARKFGSVWRITPATVAQLTANGIPRRDQ